MAILISVGKSRNRNEHCEVSRAASRLKTDLFNVMNRVNKSTIRCVGCCAVCGRSASIQVQGVVM